MDPNAPMDIEAFSALAALRGLTIENKDMLSRLYDGYCSLQVLLARLPENPDPANDPALIFIADGTETIR